MNGNEANAISFGPPRGMRDFYPADMRVRDAVFSAWETAARQFAFERYDACVVENLDLLKRKSGEEIVDQIYAFEDKSGRPLALRPEMTPTLARMISARQGEMRFPLKWFAIAQCFRYERMSKGRKREHYQWNLDVVGEKSAAAEAEIIACALRAVDILGLGPDVVVHVNSRALLADLLAAAGIPSSAHTPVFMALDKRGKIEENAVKTMLIEAGLDGAAADAALELSQIKTIEEAAARVGEVQALQALRELFALLECHGIGADRVAFDISIVRGLGYYTGIVFEAFDRERLLRAVFGGGRYDNLLSDLGGKPETAVGLGFGDVVIAELLAGKGMSPAGQGTCEVAVGFMDEAQRRAAARAACSLRRRGKNTDLALEPERAKNFFSRASALGAAHAVFIGPDDVEKGAARLKDMSTRAETEFPLAL